MKKNRKIYKARRRGRPFPSCVVGLNSQWKSKGRSLYILILHGLRGELNVCGFYIVADHQCSPATGREMVHLTMKRNTFHWITILANLFIATFIHPSLLWDFFFLSSPLLLLSHPLPLPLLLLLLILLLILFYFLIPLFSWPIFPDSIVSYKLPRWVDRKSATMTPRLAFYNSI